ncbi:tyrosine-type recombinase/integrase [Ileibacterium valens]|uniref:tyrosine-type recombinase/integrase n=1 Tax=Ileibacterium valens TaxID=1862668 RepID=UPI0035191C3F
MTLLETIELYLETKGNLKPSSLREYHHLLNSIRDDSIMSKNIRTLKTSAIKLWTVQKGKEGKAVSTINSYLTGLIKPALEMAVEDELIKRNPASFKLNNVVNKESDKGRALTSSELAIFLEYLKRDCPICNRNRNLMLIILGLGLRAAETAALTVNDIDLINNEVHISKQLIQYKNEYSFQSTKSESGDRYIPITDDLRPVIEEAILNANYDYMLDGKTGFLFSNRSGKPISRNAIGKRYWYLVREIDKEYGTKLFETSVHSLRHTFCSNLVLSGIGVKTIQYVMGHKNASVTLDIYSHISHDQIHKEFKSLK